MPKEKQALWLDVGKASHPNAEEQKEHDLTFP